MFFLRLWFFWGHDRSDIASARCLDLASLDSVRDFSSWLRSEEAALDILINNAGANFLGVDPWYTEDGIAGGPQVQTYQLAWCHSPQ